jgi:hypothetical protein
MRKRRRILSHRTGGIEPVMWQRLTRKVTGREFELAEPLNELIIGVFDQSIIDRLKEMIKVKGFQGMFCCDMTGRMLTQRLSAALSGTCRA